MHTLRKFLRNPTAMVGTIILSALVLIAVIGPFFVQDPLLQQTSIKLQPPSLEHWFGTDDFGRDVLARIVVGARYSLTAGLVAVGLGLLGGLIMGAFAGYYGGLLDQVIMTLCDIMLAFPSILLAMGVVMVMEPGIYTPMVAVGISSIPTFARLVRAQFMSLRTSSFVEAVRSSGAGDLRIIFRHLLPNSLGPVIIQATLRIGSAILMAATLSFLGLGAQPPTPEWGSMLSFARNYIWTAPYLAVIPGIAITLTVIAVNLIGDALRDFIDPRTRDI
ncbi:ABC transporter permease [uncultured Cloacibacillus sp.]|uniref:ABC transporter permease n=1 Tax=uncultured Cloacibacillus sp. TaxID=889794 RepID=UPI0026DBD4B3|nr:ABC transporter permease [uncultured Cloacibacillus sp.]